jgi:hypothetical protein
MRKNRCKKGKEVGSCKDDKNMLDQYVHTMRDGGAIESKACRLKKNEHWSSERAVGSKSKGEKRTHTKIASFAAAVEVVAPQ